MRILLDENLPYQQELSSGRIALMILRAKFIRIQDLLPAVPERIQPRPVIRVGTLPPW